MDKFGDPGFKKHLALTQIWGILAVRLANIKVLPFKATEYATTLEKHASKLSTQQKIKLNIKPLEQSISKFKTAAKKLDSLNAELSRSTQVGFVALPGDVANINAKLRAIESGFISKKGGLPGREWFKHIVFAPGLWLGYGGVVFPGILEAIDDGDEEEAQNWVSKIAAAMDEVAKSL